MFTVNENPRSRNESHFSRLKCEIGPFHDFLWPTKSVNTLERSMAWNIEMFSQREENIQPSCSLVMHTWNKQGQCQWDICLDHSDQDGSPCHSSCLESFCGDFLYSDSHRCFTAEQRLNTDNHRLRRYDCTTSTCNGSCSICSRFFTGCLKKYLLLSDFLKSNSTSLVRSPLTIAQLLWNLIIQYTVYTATFYCDKSSF